MVQSIKGALGHCISLLIRFVHKAVRKAFKGVSSILTIQRSIVAQGGGKEAQPLSIQKLDQGATTFS